MSEEEMAALERTAIYVRRNPSESSSIWPQDVIFLISEVRRLKEELDVTKTESKIMAKMGRKGGLSRAKKLTPERRSEIAKNAVSAREAKRKRVAK